MNRRIKKKRKKLREHNASKWKYIRIGNRRCHDVFIETKHSIWAFVPHEVSPWIRYLKYSRTGKIGKSYRAHQRYILFHKNE